MEIRSAEGHGTTLVVTLPVKKRGIRRMLRVLIAEDEEMIRKGLVYTTDWLSMDCVVVAGGCRRPGRI